MIPSKAFTPERSKRIIQLQLAAACAAFRGKATFLSRSGFTAGHWHHPVTASRCSKRASKRDLTPATPAGRPLANAAGRGGLKSRASGTPEAGSPPPAAPGQAVPAALPTANRNHSFCPAAFQIWANDLTSLGFNIPNYGAVEENNFCRYKEKKLLQI